MSREKTRIPQLRFPEFQNAGEWEEKRLGDVLNYERPENYIVSDTNYSEKENGLIPVLTANKSFILGYTSEKDGIFTDIPVIILDDFTVDTKYVDFHFKVKSSAIKILSAKENINLKFIFESMQLINFEAKEHKRYYISAFQNITIAVPSLPEQKKIADCLSSLDEIIANQAKKIAALNLHKKGLMQKLFPTAGERIPRMRFPEFQNAGEWEEKLLGEVALVTTGNKDTQNKKEDGIYPFFVRSQTVERIDSYTFDGEAILTSGDGVGVGKNFHYINGKFDFHQRVYCIYDFIKNVSGKFIYLYFAEYFGARVQQLSAKNSVDSVRMSMITEMPILIPEFPEQKKIADCLSSLDELIRGETKKLEGLNLHKKGLLQKLFPQMTD